MPVSPASLGMAISSTMFTSQKGAYFDARKGPGRFSVDHVGNCLEVFVKSFHLFDQHKDGTRYYAILRSGEACRTTPAYVRPPWGTLKAGQKKAPGEKAPWSKVVADSDPRMVMMLNTLYLPLPPDLAARDYVEIELMSLEMEDHKAYTWAEASRVKYMGGKTSYREKSMGKAMLHLDRLLVGDERSLDNLRLSLDDKDGKFNGPQYDAFTCALLRGTTEENMPYMNITFALRDKDLAKIDDRRDVFNIGDGVVLPIEESVILPQNMPAPDNKEDKKKHEKEMAIKYRKLFAPKLTKEMQEKKVLPLRPPCLRSELELSGMEGIQDFYFKQRGIP